MFMFSKPKTKQIWLFGIFFFDQNKDPTTPVSRKIINPHHNRERVTRNIYINLLPKRAHGFFELTVDLHIHLAGMEKQNKET